ncbi:hypothetical protein D1609_06400 [Leptospira borgpetersenii serovar Hardjo-bovis]|nr:hypothetical protein B9T54_06490 [Leptospira borgpetersenii serovar Hardjo-bovis]AYR08180.1 hypothetical protein D1609_06400 [Leptospira borgpetersenii serovar Hardjo-bovis]
MNLNRLRESLLTIRAQEPKTTTRELQKSKNSTTNTKSESLFQKIRNITTENSPQTTDSILNLQKKISDFQKKAELLENKINGNRIDLKV